MARTMTARLHQQEGTYGIRLFELFDDRFLRIRLRLGKNRQAQYAMDVAILAPEGETIHYRPWHWLYAAAAAAALLLLDILLLLMTDLSLHLLLGAMGLLIWLPFLFGWLFLQQSKHTLVFRSRYAAVPLVELLVSKPDAKAYGDFVRQLSRCISAQVQGKELTEADLRAGELRSLRKMMEDQALAPAVYEQAKQRLLGAG